MSKKMKLLGIGSIVLGTAGMAVHLAVSNKISRLTDQIHTKLENMTECHVNLLEEYLRIKEKYETIRSSYDEICEDYQALLTDYEEMLIERAAANFAENIADTEHDESSQPV